MNRSTQDLQHTFYKLFMTNPEKLFTSKHINQMTKYQYSIEDIFKARYQQIFIENINNKSVFLKVLEELQTIVAANSQIKFKSKTKDMIILKNDIFLHQYFELLFSSAEKDIINSLINHNYGIQSANSKEHDKKIQQQSLQYDSCKKEGVQSVKYMLKHIFNMMDGQEQNLPQDNAGQFKNDIIFDDL